MKERTSNRRSVTLAMLVATFLAAIEVTVVSTAMPTIVSDLGGIELISWVYAVYLLTTTVTTPIYGKLADLFGRKVIFMFGTVVFLLGSMLSGMAQSMEQLIWFRAFQGLGAGAVLPLTFTIIGDLYSYEERAKMQGVFSSVWGISGILGPLVGGFFVDFISWRWIFYFNVPIGILTLLMIWFSLHENFEKKKKHIDYPGAIAFTVGSTALLYVLLSGGSEFSWTSGTIITLLVLAVISLAAFFWIELRSPEPMLPLQIFKIRVISVSNIVGFLVSSILIAVTAYLPMWVQSVLGYGATSSGLTLTPMSLAWTVAAIIGGRLLIKLGIRSMSLIGMVLLIVATGWLSIVEVMTPYWHFIGVMIIAGVGFGFTITSMTVAVQSAVEWNQRGAATASNSFVRSLGQMLGIVVFGQLFNNGIADYVDAHLQGTPHAGDIDQLLNAGAVAQIPPDVLEKMREALVTGFHTVFVVLVGVAVAAFVFSLWMPKRQPSTEER